MEYKMEHETHEGFATNLGVRVKVKEEDDEISIYYSFNSYKNFINIIVKYRFRSHYLKSYNLLDYNKEEWIYGGKVGEKCSILEGIQSVPKIIRELTTLEELQCSDLITDERGIITKQYVTSDDIKKMIKIVNFIEQHYNEILSKVRYFFCKYQGV